MVRRWYDPYTFWDSVEDNWPIILLLAVLLGMLIGGGLGAYMHTPPAGA